MIQAQRCAGGRSPRVLPIIVIASIVDGLATAVDCPLVAAAGLMRLASERPQAANQFGWRT
ncbi:protein of unknown function [Paraburkholderia dioscoreae]|uniref:Uncharacterized protein n=1 Tax=Paraburkholderia dioscoreae TaxID=2604047 RepID=A0A5Q4Z3U2_9BURK|nr:protein of unknown function [Paraburkholderia dioscoreae]